MEPKFATRDAFNVMGVLNRIKPDAADYEGIWCNQFDPVQDQVKAFSTGEGHYGVYFASDEPGLVNMVAGMEVGDVDEAPEGLVVHTVPAAEYAVFECALDAIGLTWAAIYNEWLPGSDQYEEDESKACFDYFPPGIETGQGIVSIHVPLKARGSD